MKGIIIYEKPWWDGIKGVTYCEFINEASYELKNICGSQEFTICLKGEASECSKAICSPEDTYDFETGALIALMKICGREKVTKACDELYRDDNYKNALQKMTENCEKLMEENKCLKKENNHLKYVKSCNESTEKLTKAIDGYKQDLYKVCKRCRELETKEDILNKQEETINKREEEMSTYFGGRGNGKQYKALVELFKKIPKDKVQAAYVTAYKESLIWCTSQPSIRDSLDKLNEPISKLTVDSLIEQSRAFTRKCAEEWLYGPPTKRNEMWENILKEGRTPIYVKREDIHDFLEECQVRGIKWSTGKMPLETMPFHMSKGYDRIYFFVMTSLDIAKSTSETKEFRHVMCWWMTASDEEARNSIEYLPPMRWDLFKKGRLVVKVNYDNYKEFYEACEKELGKKPSGYPMLWDDVTISICKKDGNFEIFTMEDQKKTGRKIVNWEDVR